MSYCKHNKDNAYDIIKALLKANMTSRDDIVNTTIIKQLIHYCVQSNHEDIIEELYNRRMIHLSDIGDGMDSLENSENDTCQLLSTLYNQYRYDD